jgi:hypothetical protein
MRRSLALVSVAVATCAIGIAALAPTAQSSTKQAIHCGTAAFPPYVTIAHYGTAEGQVTCQQLSTYFWQLDMLNRAGSSLMRASGYYDDTSIYTTPSTVCNGAFVHSFMYIDESGVVDYSSSNETYCG